MSAVLGILFLAFVVPYLVSSVARARNASWAGPQTPAMRARAGRGTAHRSPGKSAARAARSAGLAVAHPGNRQIRAQARADAFTAWQQAFATDYLEQQRHHRANGKAPATAAAGPYSPQPASPASADGGGPAPAQPPSPRPATGTRPGAPGNGGPPARQSPPPAPPAPASNGGTPVAAGTSTASAEKLIEGINEIHAHAASGGINAKREAVKAVHEGFVRFGAMLAMLSRQMSEPGQNYGHEITEPLAQAGTHAQVGAMSASESDAALSTLINMTVGELATSPRRAPHHEELSETGAR